jgi:anti-sigma regulatory factor (Ser/Thr protein kinase)
MTTFPCSQSNEANKGNFMKEILLTDISGTKVPDAAAWVERQCFRYGLSDEDSFQVKTCVVEAINNSFEHAYSNGAGSINIAMWCCKDHVNIEVLDCGAAPGLNFYRKEDHATPDTERGRGWMIIEAWMNKASLMRIGEKNIVRLAKRIPV